MIPHKVMKELAGFFTALGVGLVGVQETGRSHYKMTLTCGGNHRFFIVSKSPSDKRGIKNLKCEIRRWATSLTPGGDKP